MAGESSTAKLRWELENDIPKSDPSDIEKLYKWDPEEQRAVQQSRPWTKDPNYFKRVRISALALLKMAMHAKSGGNIEVMGVMQGKVIGDTFIVIDAFALPVEGTETRVNAQAEANEYMVDFLETTKQTGRQEHIVGWYHSHPGYGCWLSGIDVNTQMTNQRYQEPFLAIVVDPHRTLAAGKVELGAFRTYPEGYTPQSHHVSQYQTIPMDKLEDFGVHAKQYYQLEVSYFKSTTDAVLLDALWVRFWAATLSSSPLLTTRDLVTGQIHDIAKKLKAATSFQANVSRLGGGRFAAPIEKSLDDTNIEQAVVDANGLATEIVKGLGSQVVKELLFNRSQSSCGCFVNNNGGRSIGLGGESVGGGSGKRADPGSMHQGGGETPMEY